MQMLPSLRAQDRQEHPRLIKLANQVTSPTRNIALTIGHGPGQPGQQPRPMGIGTNAAIGVKHFDDGGSFDDASEAYEPSDMSPAPSQSSPDLSGDDYSDLNPSTPSYSGSHYDPSVVAAINNGTGSMPSNATTSGSVGASQPTGIAGWLQNKHAGISGANWLKAGMTGLSGIIAGLASRHLSKSNPSINTPSFNSGVAPTFKPIGVPLAFAGGGSTMGIGAMRQTPGMTSGGFMQGPGDGMSDSIPANGGAAKLGDGEYVLDADTVSGIGNGSNAAGAKKLDMARHSLRVKRTGNPQQPKKVPDGSNPLLKAFR